MKIWVATVDVRHTRWWIPGVLSEVAVKASSVEMATKRAVTMARRSLPKGTRILELKVTMVYAGAATKPPVEVRS